MATLEDDYRFAKPRPTSAGIFDDEEEPLFGGSSSSQSGANCYSEYIRRNLRGDSAVDDAEYGNAQTAHRPPRSKGKSRAEYEDESQEHSEMYAVLNLDKDASTEDVLRAYRTLAVAFHPDKHTDPTLKETAQHSFERVQRAYEILSDTHKRAVYDLLGEEGLKGDWQVGPKLKTQQELQAEFEKHRLKRAQADIENLIRSRTEATVALDASSAIDASESVLDALFAIFQANIRQLFMKASTVSVLTPSTQLMYSGTMLARRGAGGGNFSMTAKHQHSQKLGIEATTTLIEPRIVTAKANYALSDETFLTFDTAIRTPYTPPPFNLTYGTRVTESITGFVKLSSGTSYSFLMPLSQTAPFPGSPSTLTAGVAGFGYSIDVTANQFLETQVSGSYGNVPLFGSGKNGWRCSVNSGVNSSGSATIGVGTERRITENTHVGLGVIVAIGGGPLTLRLRVSRLGQRLSVPIILSRQASLGMILGSVLIPGASIASLQYFYFTPRKRRKVAAMLRELREEMKEENEERRKEALEAIELLREQTDRKREQERTRDGLVILSATYRGAGESVEESEKQATQLDVAIPIQALVVAVAVPRGDPRGDKDSTSSLTIPGGRSKAHLMGFYDVLVGSRKELEIEYLFKGRKHKVIFQDRQAVAIPMRSHLID